MKRLAIVLGVLCLGVYIMMTEKDSKKKKKAKAS
jgi:hypothetical protein